jgi:PWWP domain
LATKDADLADDNMSIESADNESNRERLESVWKKLVHKLRQIPARRHSKIREVLVEAISAARKAHLHQVTTELRTALLLFRPNAPNDCKLAAIKVLVFHGDYEATGDDVNVNNEDSDDEGEGDPTNKNNDDLPTDDLAPSVLSAEAAILRSSLGGSDDARREDWVGMVKSVKTISRLASLTTAFIRDAMEKIEKLEVERDELVNALNAWSKVEDRQSKQRDAAASKRKANGSAPKDIVLPSEVWANVRYSDEICMAKTEEYPWWPAKMCEAKDPYIAKSLSQLKRSLVAFIGEMGSLRVVKTSDLQPFSGQPIEEDDTTEYTKDMRNQLDDCMAMARRIQRGLAKDNPNN